MLLLRGQCFSIVELFGHPINQEIILNKYENLTFFKIKAKEAVCV